MPDDCVPNWTSLTGLIFKYFIVAAQQRFLIRWQEWWRTCLAFFRLLSKCVSSRLRTATITGIWHLIGWRSNCRSCHWKAAVRVKMSCVLARCRKLSPDPWRQSSLIHWWETSREGIGRCWLGLREVGGSSVIRLCASLVVCLWHNNNYAKDLCQVLL